MKKTRPLNSAVWLSPCNALDYTVIIQHKIMPQIVWCIFADIFLELKK